MSTFISFLMHSGAVVIPLIYLLVTGFRGGKRGRLLRLLGIHVFCTVAIIGYTVWCRSAGYSEWYWNTALHLPVNLIFLVLYLRALLSRSAAPPSMPS